MRKFASILLVLMMVLTVNVPKASAGAPAGNWASGISCQNLDNVNDATIVISFYAEGNSTAVLSYNDTILAGQAKGYFTPSSFSSLPVGFIGSAVVSSSTPVACNVNTTSNGAGTASSPYRIGTSSGFDESQTSPTMFAPQVMKEYGGWNSYIAIQNTGAAAVTVNITYRDRNGVALPTANQSYLVPSSSNKVVYQNDNANLPTNFLGSAKVVAADGTTKLAVIANFYNSGASSTTSQFHSYNGMSAGSAKLFVPYIVRNYQGYNGGLSIQNVGSVDTSVTITFTIGSTNYIYNSPAPIAQGAALLLYTPSIAALDPIEALPSSSRYGSALIKATAPGASIVAIVNMSNLGGAGVPAERVGQGATYNAILDGTQTNKVFLPQIPRRASAIFSGGFQVANTTAVAGTCTITYAGYPAATENNVQLLANGKITRYAPSVANLPDGFNSSVKVECTQPVVGIANLAADPGTGKLGDSFTQSNGLNMP